MGARTYMVAGSKPWSRRVFDETIRTFPGTWHFAAAPGELSAGPFPHPRSAEALRAIAHRWGSVVAMPAAEAFESVRELR